MKENIPSLLQTSAVANRKKSKAPADVNETSFLKIMEVYTFGPNPQYPVQQFRLFDPFGIAVKVQCSADLIRNGQLYDIEAQVYNPTHNFVGPGPAQNQWIMYWVKNKKVTEVFVTSNNTSHFISEFKWPYFIVWWSWDSYDQFMYYLGNHEVPGVFGVRAWIRAKESYLYDIKGNLEDNNYVLRD